MWLMLSHFRPWLAAWVESAVGEEGFWRMGRPEEHFRTASSTTFLLAATIAYLVRDHPEIGHVVELGAGDGRLLADLAVAGGDLALSGVDIRPRPTSLPDTIAWHRDLWDVSASSWTTGAVQTLLAALDRPALIICAEWLDDLPCPLATRSGGALRELEVDPTGAERAGRALDAESTAWANRWWPSGRRLEVGITRDRAWSSALASLGRHGGLGLCIDYGHLRDSRPAGGSLSAFRRGRQLSPYPSPTVNLTAAVAIDAVAQAGHRVGASTLLWAQQHQVVPAWAADGPSDALAGLAGRSQLAALLNPAIWGRQWWLLQQVPGAAPHQSGGTAPRFGP
jgi:hypothetical protein